MPSTSKPIWIYTLLLLAGFPAVNQIYAIAAPRRPEDVSNAVNLLAIILFALVLAPIVFGIAWFCLRRYNPEARLFAWRIDRPVRSLVGTLLFGATAILILFLNYVELTSGGPWYEHLPIINLALWIPWLLMLRASVIEQLPAVVSQQQTKPQQRAASVMAQLTLIACIAGVTAALLALTFGIIFSALGLMLVEDPLDIEWIANQLFWNRPEAGVSFIALFTFGAGACASARFADDRNSRPGLIASGLVLTVLAVITYVDWALL